MKELILDHTILRAAPIDLWPIQQKGHDAIPASFDLLFESGLLQLGHTPVRDWALLTPQSVRIVVPTIIDIGELHKSLAAGGALRDAFVKLRCAAILDRGILTACSQVQSELGNLCKEMRKRWAYQAASDFEDPTLKPYDRWLYVVEKCDGATDTHNSRVLALPISHASRIKKSNPGVVIYSLNDLTEDALNPAMAELGVTSDDTDYEAARSEWIEIAIDSLVANIQEAVTGLRILPGEPFQNVVRIDDALLFITLDTIGGVTVTALNASQQVLERFTMEVYRLGGSRLARGLATLRRAVVS